MVKSRLTLLFLLVFAYAFSQNNTNDNIQKIVNEITKNCNNKKYGTDSLKTIENISLYREFYDNKAYKEALPHWKYLLFNAPKSSENLYIRGVKMYKSFRKEAISKEEKSAILDTILALHDIRIHCFGKSSRKMQNKTFDWYSYRKSGNEMYILEMFDSTFATYKKEKKAVPTNFLKYYLDLAIYSNKKDIISTEEVVNVFSKINEEIENNLDGEKANEYAGLQNKLIDRMNGDAIIECDAFILLVEKKYRENPNDTVVILKSYKRLKSLSCTGNSLFLELAIKVSKIRPNVAIFKYLARKSEKSGNISKTIFYIEEAIKLSTDLKEKEKLIMKISSLYYSEFNLSKSREYAKKALQLNPNNGKAYITIGRTYASSGKICGTGTDFKSHTIVWAAIDTWQKAIAVDESSRAEAQKLINKYAQYMPTKEELFLNNVKVGAKYTISCFGYTTTVRSSD